MPEYWLQPRVPAVPQPGRAPGAATCVAHASTYLPGPAPAERKAVACGSSRSSLKPYADLPYSDLKDCLKPGLTRQTGCTRALLRLHFGIMPKRWL